MVVDTDVLIWYLRGNLKARSVIADCEPLMMSAVTYMELVQGMRNANELRVLRYTLKQRGWQVLSLSESITQRAMAYVEEHFLSDSMQMADALIAATCVELGEVLVTGNVKHYRPVSELVVEPFVV